jgi:tetratricopeptide (TPR) repeat protein
MPAPSEQGWQRALEQLVDDMLGQDQIVAELAEASFDLARRCDPVEENDVLFVFGQMLRLAIHFRQLGEDQWAVNALFVTIELAIYSYVRMKSPDSMMSLARDLRDSGQSRMALAMLDDALRPDIAASADPGPDAVARIQNLRGELLRRMGEYDLAAQALTSSLEILDATSETEGVQRATVLNNLGLAYVEKGELSKGRDYLIQSLDIRGTETDALGTALTLDNLGAVEIDIASSYGPYQLGDGYVNMPTAEHLTQAESYFQRARELFESELSGSAEDYAISLLNSCRAARLRADSAALESAEALSRRALELVEQHPISAPTIWSVVSTRGEVLLELGQAQAAVDVMAPWFESLWGSIEPHERISESLTTLLRASVLTQAADVVENVAESIIGIDEQLLARRLRVGSEAEVRRLFLGYMARTEIVLGHCLPPAASGVAVPWLVELVLNRKGVLAERQGSAWLQARLAEGTRGELLDQIRTLRSEITRLDLDGSASEAIALARHRHAEAELRLGELEAQLHREAGAETAPVPRVAVADIQARLSRGTLLLEFAQMKRPDGLSHYVTFLIRPDGPISYMDLGEVGVVDEHLRTLTHRFTAPPASDADSADWDAAARELGLALAGAIGGREPRLIISPTGLWGRVPFCLLRDADGKPLIDNHLVTLVPSGRWLAGRAVASKSGAVRLPAGESVVIGDPDFDLQFADQVAFFLSLRFPRLVHTGEEAREVAGLLGVAPAVQRDATRQRLLDARRPGIVHVASHGVFLEAAGSMAELSEPRSYRLRNVAGAVVREDSDGDPDWGLGWSKEGAQPKPWDARTIHKKRVEWLKVIGPTGVLTRSGLLLTGFNAWLAGVDTSADVGTGMMSAGEFGLLDLTSTELVVLSACETGVGAVDYADGSLLGLRTSALSAGAACCVCSLWKVGDATTAKLMSAFYRDLAAGLPPAAALRAAQQAIRAEHRDPYFWAGWVAEGEGHLGLKTLPNVPPTASRPLPKPLASGFRPG